MIERMLEDPGHGGPADARARRRPRAVARRRGVYVDNKFHAMDVDVIKQLGVSAVLNCASMGIRGLPLDAYEEAGIEYNHTNVKRDEVTYPILHQPDGERSDHLKKAAAVYEVRAAGAWRSSSASPARTARRRWRWRHADAARRLAGPRPRRKQHDAAVHLREQGLQRQLVELEEARAAGARGAQAHRFGSELMPKRPRLDESPVDDDGEEKEGHVLCELFVPGVGPINLWLPSQCSIDTARWYLITAVDHELEKEEALGWRGSSSTFGANLPEGFNLVLEDAAVERHVQLARLRDAFGLELVGDDPLAADCEVRWTGACRFEVILFTFFWRPPPADDAAASAAAAWSGLATTSASSRSPSATPSARRRASTACSSTPASTRTSARGTSPQASRSGRPSRSSSPSLPTAPSRSATLWRSRSPRARQQFDAPGDRRLRRHPRHGQQRHRPQARALIVEPAPPPAAQQSSDDLAAVAAAAPPGWGVTAPKNERLRAAQLAGEFERGGRRAPRRERAVAARSAAAAPSGSSAWWRRW